MKLLYVYTQFCDEGGNPALYRGFSHWECNFGTDRVFSYDTQKKELRAEARKSALPEGFWGENIYNITAIIGDNGSGKTTILHYMMSLFQQIYEGRVKSRDKNIIVFQNENQLCMLTLPEGNMQQLDMDMKCIQTCENVLRDLVKKLKLVYLANTLDVNDYRRLGSKLGGVIRHFSQNDFSREEMRYRFLYDCSTCGLILSDLNNDLRIDTKQIRDMSGILWLGIFFDYEQYKQVKYVFDKNQMEILKRLKAKGYSVPVPERLYLHLESADYRKIQEFQVKEVGEEHLFPRSIQAIHCQEKLVNGDLLSFMLCSNCVLSLLRSVREALYLQDYGKLIDVLLKPQEKENVTKVSQLCKEEFIEIVNKAIEFCKGIEEEEAKQFCSLGVCYITFIDYVFEEKSNLMNHFRIETNLSDEVFRNNQALELSISTEDSHWFCNFLKIYRYICNPYYFINFSWGLSSGEANLLRLFSSFYYIFSKDYTNEKNGDYEIQNRKWNGEGFDSEVCDSMIIFMDEADLTYHPEWQRRFISIINAFIPEIYPKSCCKDIQVILSTHSPLLLGDMPQGNVMYLKTDEEKRLKSLDNSGRIETFGQNIHMLFRDGFFLKKGTIGEFAGNKIKEVIAELEKVRMFLEYGKGGTLDVSWNSLNRCQEMVEILSPGIIREKLKITIVQYKEQLEMLKNKEEPLTLHKLEEPRTGRDANKLSDEELEQLIETLQGELRERKRNDKN